MSKYSLSESTLSTSELRNLYNVAKSAISYNDFNDLDLIFEVALKDYNLFPAINNVEDEASYLESWIKKYCDSMNNLPSQRIAKPKSACSDPAIRAIVQISQALPQEESFNAESMHNLFMSAENIQGKLLEEYIAQKIRPYGFLWCNGDILHAIDFCNYDGSLLLQIKNKSNTENSSSSTIREGTSIEKWYRLGTRRKNGVLYPDYKWMKLNNLINENKSSEADHTSCNLNEEDYIIFLRKVASDNSHLITDK